MADDDRRRGFADRALPVLRHPLVLGLTACVVAGVLVAGLLAPVAAGGAVLSGASGAAVEGGDPDTDLDTTRVARTTTVLDAEGGVITDLYRRYRLPVGPGGIADVMRAAIVSIEDRRFYEHQGVDWRGLGRALVSNAASGSPLEGQGASTLTMQYVKNYRLYALADTDAEREAATADTIGRKLAEVRLASAVEQQISKEQILERYLDLVYFGRSAYGIEAAAQVWFGTTAAQLTLPQAALLAGMVRSPSAYDPVDNPETAEGRRLEVLRAMVATGAITPAQGARADAAPLGVVENPSPPPRGCTSARSGTGFFCSYLLDTLVAAGMDRADLETGGYTIRTTLDPEVNREAERAVDEQIGADSDVVDVAAVVAPGQARRPVLALAASRPFGNDGDAGESAYPLPTAPLRGAGSIYKVFTAAAALEAGLVEPDTELDVPEEYTAQSFLDDGAPYTVGNIEGADYPDELTLTEALATSPNTPFVALTDRLGVAPLVDAARRLGLRQTLGAPSVGDRDLGQVVVDQQRASFTLGPGPTSPLELANVGATIVSGGTWCAPTPVVEVIDRDGRPVDLPQPPCERAVSPDVADDLVTALSEDDEIGSAENAADSVDWDRPVIGKTGTTERNASAAFLGATAQYAGATMVFDDQGTPDPVCLDPVRTCSDGELTGSTVPAFTWFDLMSPLHEGTDEQELPLRASSS